MVVGFHKVGSGKQSMTWPESVDAALCFGWIDGVRKGIDAERYQIRFTPRKKGSIWSAVNIARVAELTARGLMMPAGLRAFGARTEAKSGVYAYEQSHAAVLLPDEERVFRADAAAWTFLESRGVAYRQRTIWHVTSAKQAVTRARRLAALIEACRESRML